MIFPEEKPLVPPARRVGRHAGPSGVHRRKNGSRSGPVARVLTPVLGIALMGSAAMAAASGTPDADVSGTVIAGDQPGAGAGNADVEELRDSASDGTSRSTDRDAVPPTTGADDPPPPADTATEPPPDDSHTEVAVTPSTTPEASVPDIAPVEGCAATVPDREDVSNGALGAEHLCGIGDGHELRPDAAAAFLALAGVYEDETGDSLLQCVTDSYRSYDAQVTLKDRKPYLAAAPGTSNHGWGVAVDLGCGANSYDGALYEWLDDSGAEFGWENPGWARSGGSKPEPWHWEFDPDLVG